MEDKDAYSVGMLELDPILLEVFNKTVLNQDKLRILMVLSEKSEANDFWVGGIRVTDDDIFADPKNSAVSKILEGLGLKVSMVEELVGEQRFVRLYYAKSQASLDKLIEIMQKSWSKDRDLELGHIYGFPETAIESFPDGSIEKENLPDTIRNHRYFHNFLGFRLSKNHYQEEWQEFVEMIDGLGRDYPQETKAFELDSLIN